MVEGVFEALQCEHGVCVEVTARVDCFREFKVESRVGSVWFRGETPQEDRRVVHGWRWNM